MAKINDEISKFNKLSYNSFSSHMMSPLQRNQVAQSVVVLFMRQAFPELYDTKQADTDVRRLKQIENSAPTLSKLVGSYVKFLQKCRVLRLKETSEYLERSKVNRRCYLTRAQVETCLHGIIQARKNDLAPEIFYEYSVKIVDVLASSNVLSPDFFYKILTLKNPQYALCILRGIKCCLDADVDHTRSNDLLGEYANQVIENSEHYADRFVFFAMCHLAFNMESVAPQRLFNSDEVNCLLSSELFKSKRLTKALIDLPLEGISVRLVKQIVGMVKENTPLDRVLTYLEGARDSHGNQLLMGDSMQPIVNEYKDMCKYCQYKSTAESQLLGVGLFGSADQADDVEPVAQSGLFAAAS